MVPFVGPSYNLRVTAADCQRTVNMCLKKIESGTGKANYILESVPGMVERFDLSGAPKVRGFATVAGGRTFIVYGSALAEVASDMSQLTGLATLATDTGPVSIAIGRDHIVVADGSSTPVYYDLSASSGFYIIDANMYPASWVVYLGGRFVFGRDGTDQFFWSAQDDPTRYDALDFATAEAMPDGVIRGLVYREELWLMGTATIEVYRVSQSADSAFEKNTGVSISIGCIAKWAAQIIDNSLFWLGQDDNGGAIVYRCQGYTPQRVSTYAVEEKLQASVSIASARAFCYQMDGQAFYCVSSPGVDTTWCFEVQGNWHEMAELVNGSYTASRAVCHVYTGLRHLVGTDDGFVYELDKDVYTNAGDVLCRERISPHSAIPPDTAIFFPRARLICSAGTVTDDSSPMVELSYSNDGGRTWHDTLPRSLGEVGETNKAIRWNRLGHIEPGQSRAWKVRCTDNVQFDIIDLKVDEVLGS